MFYKMRENEPGADNRLKSSVQPYSLQVQVYVYDRMYCYATHATLSLTWQAMRATASV